MSSKQLESILNRLPSATVNPQQKEFANSTSSLANNKPINNSKVVVYVPLDLKNEIKEYIKKNKGETESLVVLKALKQFGFNVPENFLVDRRKNR